MTTATAEKNGFKCPKCGDDLTHDKIGRGFVRHKTNPTCDLERGQRTTKKAGVNKAAHRTG